MHRPACRFAPARSAREAFRGPDLELNLGAQQVVLEIDPLVVGGEGGAVRPVRRKQRGSFWDGHNVESAAPQVGGEAGGGGGLAPTRSADKDEAPDVGLHLVVRAVDAIDAGGCGSVCHAASGCVRQAARTGLRARLENKSYNSTTDDGPARPAGAPSARRRSERKFFSSALHLSAPRILGASPCLRM